MKVLLLQWYYNGDTNDDNRAVEQLTIVLKIKIAIKMKTLMMKRMMVMLV